MPSAPRLLRVLLAGLLAVLVLAAGLAPAPACAADAPGVVEKILDILKARGQISEAEYQELKALAEEERKAQAAAQAAQAAPTQAQAQAPAQAGTVAVATIEPATPSTAAGAPPALKPGELAASFKDGLHLESADGQMKFKLGGRAHLDVAAVAADQTMRQALGDNAEGFGTEFRRIWLESEGEIRRFIFRLNFDLANQKVVTQDAYVGLKKIPWVGRLRLGNQKEPFSLEQLTSNGVTTFMERSMADTFAQAYKLGIQLDDSPLGGRLHWAAGVFADSPSGSADFNNYDDWDAVVRLAGTPWYEDNGRYLLHLGGAYSHQFRGGGGDPLGYSTRPEAHLAPVTANTGDIAASGADLLGAEAALVLGPLSLQGEFMQSFVDGSGGSLSFPGAYVFASYFLTGENRPYANGIFGRVTPRNPVDFDFEGGGLGAWELAARWSWLDLNDSAGALAVSGGEQTDLTGGVNWYLTSYLRVMLNYVYAHVEDRETGASIASGDMHIVQTRFALDF